MRKTFTIDVPDWYTKIESPRNFKDLDFSFVIWQAIADFLCRDCVDITVTEHPDVDEEDEWVAKCESLTPDKHSNSSCKHPILNASNQNPKLPGNFE